jgi:membrane protein required for colicin V production
MNLFDGLLLAVLAWSTIAAFVRGILREVFSLAGVIAGILLASWYYPRVAIFFSRWIASVPAAHIVAFLLIVVLVMLLFGLVGKLLQRTASALGLGFFDRSFGALFGLLRGCLLGVAVMMAVAAFFPTAAWVSQSTLAPYLLRGAHAVSFVVPRDFRQQIRNGAQRILEAPPG